jgi:hypothetical protein
MLLTVVNSHDHLKQWKHSVRSFKDQFAIASLTGRDLLELLPEDRHLIHLVDERDVLDNRFLRNLFTRDLHFVGQKSTFPVSREKNQYIFHIRLSFH